MLLLHNLAAVRITRDLKRAQLAAITTIDVRRIRSFETTRERAEPWLDEALTLSRALCTDGIVPLITTGTIDEVDAGSYSPSDVAHLRDGARLPLSHAVRICQHYGLPDPAYLVTTPLHRQIWDILSATERHPEAAGWCPWCSSDIFGGQEHADRCLPNLLFGPRGNAVRITTHDPRPARMGASGRGGLAHGLKDLRLRAGLTQKQLGEASGTNSSYLARIERLVDPLSEKKAYPLAAALRCDVSLLYKHPEGAPPASDPGFDASLSTRARIEAMRTQDEEEDDA